MSIIWPVFDGPELITYFTDRIVFSDELSRIER